MATLGDRLRRARDRKGLIQKEVEAKTGITDKSLSRYETNRSEPDSESLLKLAKLYEVSTDWLLGNEVKNTNKPINNDQAKNDELLDIISRLPQDKKESLLKFLKDN